MKRTGGTVTHLGEDNAFQTVAEENDNDETDAVQRLLLRVPVDKRKRLNIDRALQQQLQLYNKQTSTKRGRDEDHLGAQPALVEGASMCPPFLMLAAAQQRESSLRICSVCWAVSHYRCPQCRSARYCSAKCSYVHEHTRCMKYVI